MPSLLSPSRKAVSKHRDLLGRSFTDESEELVYEETAELFHHFAHPERQTTDDTLIGEVIDEEEEAKIKKLPWWKRPSPYWLLCVLPFTAVAMTALLAPRVEIYTILVCRQIKPDIYYEKSSLAGTALLSSSASTPTRSQLCAADPVVQAGVSKFATMMTTSMGILSCLSTGWWSAFSDRYGRCRVMGISVIGLLLTDLNFIFIVSLTERFPGAYWILLLGPILEGCLGGFTSAAAAIHAYQADVVDEHRRSRFFSLVLGLLFVGMAVGPTLGSLVIRSTGRLISIFYVSTGIHFLYALFVWFILPESLSLSYRLRAREKYAQRLRTDVSEDTASLGIRTLNAVKKLFGFLAPLNVFFPEVKEMNNNPLKKKRNWNLTLVGLAYFMVTSLMGIYTYAFQYAASTFGWTSETLGYWLSLVSGTKAFFLAAILPLAIKLFKPKPKVVEMPSETVPLLSSSDQKTLKKKEIHSLAFDLNLARISLLIEIVGFMCMGFALTPIAFTASGMFWSMGAAFTPANQAVALALFTERGGTETGRLFGALSVLQSLGSQILGPSLFAFIYMKTVATYPRTIFFVAVGAVVVSATLLAFVRLPNEHDHSHATLVAEESDISSGSSARTILNHTDGPA
ncbi:hypothetical protein AGABI1DRAFT_68063 [Agaricus bisporus var. burnettii JB137-S8]|uniref:Major facilitator superfamily (MFS) profile domain-containing protein n=1 Tax=Agaricus bisporus var. burnettii (strain JB137-S8 / ATCC MYA-4627 / FGSC 10392) TaxID=597362 RepID=K5Y3C9_AGABU|nr:uncharacterized protein AGABI1DRAFT_68063 [Agaricus bisporus var. burnettii JB137-S8]EKM82440.1 hypothetical protein AGABI1DRAFT_68063 [Agaricus bisporus var. burnettii JB137-S8]